MAELNNTIVKGKLSVTEEINVNGNKVVLECEETTWSALKTLRDNSQLVPGKFYRITDYTCTTTTENTSSAGHVFDIIVLALENNKLSEEAWAAHHSGDTYFADSKLEGWKLWYCLDNDAARFGWAFAPVTEHLVYSGYMSFVREPQYDGVNGNYCWSYGSIDYIFTDTLDAPTAGSYWMFMNSSWRKLSDSVSVQYVPATTVEGKGVIYRMIDEFGNDVPYDFKNMLFTDSSSTPKYTNAYTFTYTESSTIKDASILGLSKLCYNNVMKKFFSYNTQQLNFNVFNSIYASFECHSNTLGANCYRNTLGANCKYNTFGKDCTSNTFDRNCQYNIFDNNCYNNTFGTDCKYNTFGTYFQYNTFGTYCQNNTFGTYCQNNTFGTDCQCNAFGNECKQIKFGTYCKYNMLGNYCNFITFGTSSSTQNYYRYNIIDNGCQYLYINSSDAASYSNQLQNIHIHSGVQGSSSSNRRTITIDRNLAYSTDVYAANSKEIILNA